MATNALLATVVLYVITAAGYYKSGKYGLAMSFVCYAIANIGFILEGSK